MKLRGGVLLFLVAVQGGRGLLLFEWSTKGCMFLTLLFFYGQTAKILLLKLAQIDKLP